MGIDSDRQRLILLSGPPESSGRSRTVLVILLVLVLSAAAIAYYLLRPKPGPRLTLKTASYDQLIGWQEDPVAAAIPTFLKSCGALGSRSEAALRVKRGAGFGRRR